MYREIYYSEEVANYYQYNDNIELLAGNPNSCVNLICFSDNGLFYPWTEDKFHENIVIKNKFQWRNLTNNKEIRNKYKYIVFVRDIYQSWYINGTSARYNTPEKVADRIKELTGGGTYVTIGSSAGGYYAVLVGTFLNAEYVLSLSGQFLIGNQYETNPLIENATEKQRRYFYLGELLARYQGTVFYFCPYNCQRDFEQYEAIKGYDCVKCFKCRSARHGNTILPQSIQWAIKSDCQELLKQYTKEKGKIVNERVFLTENIGVAKGLAVLGKRLYEHRVKNVLRR